MKNSIEAMEAKTSEAMKALIQMMIDEDEVNVKTMSAIGLLTELIDSSFAVQYAMAEELSEIKRLVAQR